MLDWEGFYQVSRCGRVRSVDRVCHVVNRFGDDEARHLQGKQLKASTGVNGYRMVSFTRPGVRVSRTVHSLVASAWLGPCPLGHEICHRDGRRDNNAAENLRYGTRSSNALDRHHHGTMNQAHGEDHYFRKLTEADVKWLRSQRGRASQRALADTLGVSHGTVGCVLRGVSWRHVQ
ncbi:NUMOD4 motif-containing HNH endonuclease [Bosea lathyri]|uniref:NUMOD4 motif-containing HNH endonuclease n=1 Tax=Bosea lathyri TaxID=1036778 RepID=UPI003CC7F5B3